VSFEAKIERNLILARFPKLERLVTTEHNPRICSGNLYVQGSHYMTLNSRLAL
jgi:hypothetical protein